MTNMRYGLHLLENWSKREISLFQRETSSQTWTSIQASYLLKKPLLLPAGTGARLINTPKHKISWELDMMQWRLYIYNRSHLDQAELKKKIHLIEVRLSEHPPTLQVWTTRHLLGLAGYQAHSDWRGGGWEFDSDQTFGLDWYLF